MLIDLQFHSTYSDGYLTPSGLVKFIAKQGVKVAALTDHNTVDGLHEFKRACRAHKIKPINGLELYVRLGNKKFNLLWFNFDDKNRDLRVLLRGIQTRRRARVRFILKKLAHSGFKININKIINKYAHYIPLNHIADEIWKIPHNRAKIKNKLRNKKPREDDIIRACFYNKWAGILKESYIDIARVIKLREKIGGQLVINHPGKYKFLPIDVFKKLKKMGIDGIEVLSPHHSVGAVMYAQFMAQELKFIISGGSDFHRFEGGNYKIHNSWQYFKIDSNLLDGVEKIIS